MPSPVLAETGTISMLPPQSTGCSPCSTSCCLTRSGCASGLSILLIATTIGTFGGLDVRDGFFRLRHDAVVGRNDENRNVGDFRAARAHCGKRFVTRRIDERDLAIVLLDGIRADLLRDAAGFAAGDVGLTDLIEQRRLTVIDVTENRDDRRTRRHHFGLVFFLLDGDFFAGFFDDGVESELLRNGNGNVARNILIDRRHRAHLDEFGDDVFGRNDHRRRKFLHGQQVGNFDRFELTLRRNAARRDRLSSCDCALSRAA